MSLLKGKNILIGVTASIAAYKVIDTIRQIKSQGANVRVILTESSKKFVSKMVIETFLEEKVYDDLWQNPLDHINLARWCDAFLITPLSANTLCKISNGIADNLLSNVFLACNKPKLLAPAMNTVMLESKQVQRALTLANEDGIKIIQPEEGFLACNEYGKGHIASDKTIIANLNRELFGNKLFGKNIVITGGGTYEDLDPIRHLGNKSSGYFAICLAKAFYNLGANVSLITASVSHPLPCYVKNIKVSSAKSMLDACLNIVENEKVDCFISAAAVSDYFIKNKSDTKLKKQEKHSIELGLNSDIVKQIANMQKNRPQKVVAFCAETKQGNELLQSAKNKLKNKNADYIIANQIAKNKGFGTNATSVFMLNKQNDILEKSNKDKQELAYNIIDFIF